MAVRFSRFMNLNLNVWSAKGSTAHLQQICAVLVLCALKNSAVNLCWWYKNKKSSNAQWGLAWALKASLKASVLAASIIVSGISFHSLTDLGKKLLFIYISPATSNEREIGELLAKNITRTAGRQLDGWHLLFGEYLRGWTTLYLLNLPINMLCQRRTKNRWR